MSGKTGELWLAPLRGVTIRAFREAFAGPIREAGFDGAFAPFIPANPGIRVNDRMLADLGDGADGRLVPQVITKHPDAMRVLLRAFRDKGFLRADLNAGCPFPMIVRRGRGSGLFRTPDVLERLLAAGCEEMGPGRFSLKIRLGLSAPDELLSLMPMINRYPLAVLTIHARTAKQMYDGNVDLGRFRGAGVGDAPRRGGATCGLSRAFVRGAFGRCARSGPDEGAAGLLEGFAGMEAVMAVDKDLPHRR